MTDSPNLARASLVDFLVKRERSCICSEVIVKLNDCDEQHPNQVDRIMKLK